MEKIKTEVSDAEHIEMLDAAKRQLRDSIDSTTEKLLASSKKNPVEDTMSKLFNGGT